MYANMPANVIDLDGKYNLPKYAVAFIALGATWPVTSTKVTSESQAMKTKWFGQKLF